MAGPAHSILRAGPANVEENLNYRGDPMPTDLGKDIAGHPCTPNGSGLGITLPLGSRPAFRQLFSFQAPMAGGQLLTPGGSTQARLEQIANAGQTLGMACINGSSGVDAMTQPDAVLDAVKRIRSAFPEADICLTVSGLNLPAHLPELISAGLTRLAINVNAVTLEAAKRLYQWVRPSTRTLPKDEGIALLLEDQEASVRQAVQGGLVVTVETLVSPALGADNAKDVAAWSAERGVDAMRLLPAAFDDDGQPVQLPDGLMAEAEAACAPHLDVKPADCCCGGAEEALAESGPAPSDAKPYVAVATDNGADVNVHLGHADKLLVYGSSGGHGRMVEVRQAPPKGGGGQRWSDLAGVLSDCFALLVADAGDSPRAAPAEYGITVRSMPDAPIEDAVADTLGLQRKKR